MVVLSAGRVVRDKLYQLGEDDVVDGDERRGGGGFGLGDRVDDEREDADDRHRHHHPRHELAEPPVFVQD